MLQARPQQASQEHMHHNGVIDSGGTASILWRVWKHSCTDHSGLPVHDGQRNF